MQRHRKGNRLSVTADLDDNRPFFKRKPGELSLWIDLYDAEPEDTLKFGSRQYFLMDLKERYHEEFCKLDLCNIKEFCETRKILHHFCLLYFLPGVLLICHSNAPEAVEELIEEFESGRLATVLSECLVTPQMLTTLEVKYLQLSVRLMEDELNAVDEDWVANSVDHPYTVKEAEREAHLVARMVRYQKTHLFKYCSEMKDLEDHYRDAFPSILMVLHFYISLHGEEEEQNEHKIKPLKNLHDVNKFLQRLTNLGVHEEELCHLRIYLAWIQRVSRIMTDIERNFAFPQLQIRLGVEKPKQRSLFATVHQRIAAVKSATQSQTLFPQANAPYAEPWLDRLIPKEQPIFSGFVCLLPFMIHNVVELDHTLDAYLQNDNFLSMRERLKTMKH